MKWVNPKYGEFINASFYSNSMNTVLTRIQSVGLYEKFMDDQLYKKWLERTARTRVEAHTNCERCAGSFPHPRSQRCRSPPELTTQPP
ncbi:hypothetical protein JTE90_010023 [Oedothorax gibbosus]|uniref:Uncharacterized protein n=1 Tax=Oedothorax gibbosus TaxID=931172 RepID=A0AAV6TYA2_9ARAC|nr:hypothetical protein JTE90_010023 [Oedothorax gibbosus]